MKLVMIGLLLLVRYIPSSAQTETSDPCVAVTARVTAAETKLRDWPALNRYRELNSKVTPAETKEVRVVFLGDSITDSWDDKRFNGFFPGKPYINRGISGQTTPQMLIRFRADVIALQPKVVMLLAGTNDLAGNTGPTTAAAIEDNLLSIAELAHANKIRLVFASVLPVSDYEKNKDGQPINRTNQRPPDQINALNTWMRNYAAAHRLVYLDYFSSMVDSAGFLREELSEDGLHPNQKGYDVMAPLAEKAIAASLKRKP